MDEEGKKKSSGGGEGRWEQELRVKHSLIKIHYIREWTCQKRKDGMMYVVQTEARAMNKTQKIWAARAFENTIMSRYNLLPEEMSSSSKPVINYWFSWPQSTQRLSWLLSAWKSLLFRPARNTLHILNSRVLILLSHNYAYGCFCRVRSSRVSAQCRECFLTCAECLRCIYTHACRCTCACMHCPPTSPTTHTETETVRAHRSFNTRQSILKYSPRSILTMNFYIK